MKVLSINKIIIDTKDDVRVIVSCKEAKNLYKRVCKDIDWNGMNEIILPDSIEDMSLKAIISVVSLIQNRVPVCNIRCHFKLTANRNVREKVRRAILLCG